MLSYVNIGTKEKPMTGAIELYNPVKDEVSALGGSGGMVQVDELVTAVEVLGTAQVEGGFVINGINRNRLSVFTLPSTKHIEGGSFILRIATQSGRVVMAQGWIEPVSVEKIKQINDLYPKLKVVDKKALAFAEAVLADPAQVEWHEEMQKFLNRRVDVQPKPAPEVPVTGVVDLGTTDKVVKLLEEALQLLKGK